MKTLHFSSPLNRLAIVTRHSHDAKHYCFYRLGCSHCIFIPTAQPEVVLFWCQNERPCFFHITSASNKLYFGSYRIFTYFRYTNYNFLTYFHNSLTPVSHTYFCPREENKKQPWSKIVQNVSKGEGQSVESEKNTHVKMGTSRFNVIPYRSFKFYPVTVHFHFYLVHLKLIYKPNVLSRNKLYLKDCTFLHKTKRYNPVCVVHS